MNQKETHLQQAVTQLRTRLLVMCAAVGIALDEAGDALMSANMGKACAVVDNDVSINALENEIDDMALSLLVRGQPMAQDLRFVVAVLRMVNDLERIGDEAASIAERTLILHERLPEPVMAAVQPLLCTACTLYKDSVEAFRTANAEKAMAIRQSEDESAQMEVRALHAIVEYFHLNSGEDKNRLSYTGMHGILICRSLSRVCRRAANIAEHTYFMAKGINIKHAALPSSPAP